MKRILVPAIAMACGIATACLAPTTAPLAHVTTPGGNTYLACDLSRMVNTPDEQTCGDLQDATSTEFMCEANNRSVANVCWIEPLVREVKR